ncbi:MAG: glycosyltransferase family 2 protein [Candidatus Aminicenantes bacterium]|nr:glycosyltransferase family 2 protein [Candidatus Aminicenantes bacterium]
MKISIIMVDGGFREYIFAAEYFSNQDFPAADYEITWNEYFDRPHPGLKNYPRVDVRTLNRKGIYHSSYCFNAGIKAARGEILVIPDADIMVDNDFLSSVYEEHCKNPELVMYFYRFCQDEKSFDRNDFSFEYIKKTSSFMVSNIDNYGGCLSVRKKWLLQIDGYEQHRAFATGNHANGKDVYTRLKNLGLYIKWHPHKFLYHPWHPGTQGAGRDDRRIKWQKKIIEYKATRLMTNAFEGINNICPEGYRVPPPPAGDPDK